jgi:hypothetical protein
MDDMNIFRSHDPIRTRRRDLEQSRVTSALTRTSMSDPRLLRKEGSTGYNGVLRVATFYLLWPRLQTVG